jgi:lipid-A-disaccharide synthase
MATKLLIVAGDPSGDQRGAELIESLYRQMPGLELYGLGGPGMAQTRINFLFNLVELSIIGFTEAIKKYFVYRGIFKDKIIPFLKEQKPDGVILIDFYGFNIHVAISARRLNIPVIYYISPQVWASRAGRIRKLARFVDKMIVIFPFEEGLYKKAGLDVTFVGHPFMDITARIKDKDKKEIIEQMGLNPDKPVVGILPGSRVQEIDRLLPVMLEAAKKIVKRVPETQFILPLSPTISAEQVRAYIERSVLKEKDTFNIPNLKIVRDANYHARSIMTLALVASGSATLENASLGIPMVIVYKVSFVSYLLARMLVKIPWIGMANIIAGRKIVPEFIQHEAEAGKIAQAAIEWLLSPSKLAQVKEELNKVKGKLGTAGASQRAARIILETISITGSRVPPRKSWRT